MALVTYTDPVILDSTGQDIVTQLTRLANTQTYTAGDGININSNVISTKVASASQLGAVKVGDGLSIDGSTNELSVVVDSALSTTSENPVQNKVITNAINAISSMSFEVVQELPTTDIRTDVIYLVPKSTAQTSNTYDEYICLDATTTPATWEKIGDTQIDLSNYIQKSSTEGLVKNDGSIDTSIGINVSTLNSNVATLQSYMPSGVSAQNTLITEGTVNNRLATKVDALNLCYTEFSTSTSYYVGEYVRYNGTIYKCITDHPAGEWNSNHFSIAQIYRVMNEKNNTAPEFNSGLNLAVGDYCFRHNKLYRCTTSHFGQWDASHFTHVVLTDELKLKANTSDVPTVSVSHTGTASSTGVRKQIISVDSVNYDVDGSAYMEQSVTLSTSAATTVTFTNAIIADGAMLTMASSIWDLVPDSMTTAVGSCTITLPKWTSAETIGVRLYVR